MLVSLYISSFILCFYVFGLLIMNPKRNFNRLEEKNKHSHLLSFEVHHIDLNAMN